jgi:hypothetical protein
LFGILFVSGIIHNTYLTVLQRLSVSVNIFGLLAFWGLGLQKRIFRQYFWRLYFFIDALVFVLLLVFGRKYNVPLLWCIIFCLITAIVYVPYYIGMFIYAFRSKHIWEEAGYKPSAIYREYTHYPWLIKKWFKQLAGFFKLPATVALVILCLTFIPAIIRNNRVIHPVGNSPKFYERMLKYRRTTIPELQEFERLFPNYLCVIDYGKSDIILDPNGTGEYVINHDLNSPVRWRLSAGLHKRYLVVMETNIIFAVIDPETEKLFSLGSHDEPVFSLWEVGSVSAPLSLFTERFAWANPHKVKTLTHDEWKKLVQGNGDFSVLGIELKKDDPIPNFELAFQNNQ